MWEVIVEAKVSTLGVHERQSVAVVRVAAESLLHPKNGLDAADPAIEPAERLRPVVRLNPVTLRVMAPRKLGAKAKGRVLWFPPDVCPIEVLVCRWDPL